DRRSAADHFQQHRLDQDASVARLVAFARVAGAICRERIDCRLAAGKMIVCGLRRNGLLQFRIPFGNDRGEQMIHGCEAAMCAVEECVPGLTPGGALRGLGSAATPAPTRNGRLRAFVRGFMAILALAAMAGAAWAGDGETAPARDPKQPVDEAYTAKMKEYTTAPYFTSPLVDYLPASKNVPTPAAVLGDVAGAPGILPYAEDVYKYMRLLEKASPRVKV